MCGIYGFINTRQDNNFMDLFQSLGILSEPRGTHATGFYGISGDDVLTNKGPQKASDFFKTPAFTTVKNCYFSTLIGHNRWYTHGDPVNNVNNHPFTSNRFGFIHNGVVGSVDVSEDDLEMESECDSEKIFRYFLKKFYNNHCDIYAALRKTMTKFDRGSYACALVDSKTRDLYLFLNSGRSISYILDKDYGLMIFASQDDFIRDGLKANKIHLKGKMIDLECGQIVKISEDLTVNTQTVKLQKPIEHHSVKHNLKRYSFGLGTDQTPWKKVKTGAPWKNPTKSWKHEALNSGIGVVCKICMKKGTIRKFLDAAYAKGHVSKEHGIFDPQKLEESILDLAEEKKKKEEQKPRVIWRSNVIWR